MKRWGWLALAVALGPSSAHASSFDIDLVEGKRHITADRTLYHSKEKIYEAFGHVVVSSKEQRLSADYVWIDSQRHEIKARGNVTFVTSNSVVQAAEIHFNLITKQGSIFYGKVSNDFYSLSGQLIRKVSDDRFLTTDGEYTTCKDCAESWKFSAKNVDLTVEGYAFMESVFIKIKDSPSLYFPYLIVPVKRKRQSGLLFPRISTSSRHGFAFVQPFFLAIDEHQDATLGLGRYTSRGLRAEMEYRYMSYNGISGQLTGLYTQDKSYRFRKNRSAIIAENNWPFFEHAKMKWRVREVSDQEYPRTFTEDIIGNNEPALESNAIVSFPFNDFFISGEVKRYRNLLYEKPVGLDGNTVQTMPSVYFGVKERELFGNIAFNLTGRYDNFTRRDGAFLDVGGDKLFDVGVDTLREAQRLILTPEIAAPIRIGQAWSLSPSVQYNEMRYRFSLPTANERFTNTERRYLLTSLETSTVLEKVYNYDGERISKVKHQVSPFVTYNYIPWLREDPTHPFTAQLRRDGGLFDQYDIVPVSNSTSFLRLPLGNAISYGIVTRLIRKRRTTEEMPRAYPYDLLPTPLKVYPQAQNKKQEVRIASDKRWDAEGPRYDAYEQVWDMTVSQAYDVHEARRAVDRKRAFSLLLVRSNLNIDDFSNVIEYKYFPRAIVKDAAGVESVFNNKHSFTISTTWWIKKLQNSTGTLFFTRKLAFGFTNTSWPTPSRQVSGEVSWSLNDFFNVSYLRTHDLISRQKLEEAIRGVYSSPSECWQLGLRYTRTKNAGREVALDLGVNLLGNGYVGLNQLPNQAAGGGRI